MIILVIERFDLEKEEWLIAAIVQAGSTWSHIMKTAKYKVRLASQEEAIEYMEDFF